jgi:hypothetical protein
MDTVVPRSRGQLWFIIFEIMLRQATAAIKAIIDRLDLYYRYECIIDRRLHPKD